VINAVIDQSKITVHALLVDDEAEEMLHQLEHMLEPQHLSVDQYLKMIRKTRTEYLSEIRPQAEQRIKRQLVLDAVVKEENIVATPEEIEALFQLYTQVGQELSRSEAQTRALTASFQREKAISRLLELTTDPDPDEAVEEEASVANAEAAALVAGDLTDEGVASGEAHSEPAQAEESATATTLSTEPMTETTA